MEKSFKYDAFISHAFEDQEEIANPLYVRLKRAGIRVWYSSQDMRVGYDLEKTILEDVIPNSQFGIVIISKDYFLSDWGRRELEALNKHENARQSNIILPIWHMVDEGEVTKQFPYLANRFAVKSEKGLEYVVGRIVGEIRIRQKLYRKLLQTAFRHRQKILIFLSLIITIVASGLYIQHFVSQNERNNLIAQNIQARIDIIDQEANSYFDIWATNYNSIQSNFTTLKKIHSSFVAPSQKCKRNQYEFKNGTTTLKSRRAIDFTGVNTQGFYSAYGIDMFKISFAEDSVLHKLNFAFLNDRQMSYSILGIVEINPIQIAVTVKYIDWLRFISGTLIKNETKTGCQSQQLFFFGLQPVEKYVFEKKQGRWVLTATQ